MSIINKGTAFSNGEQLTADKLNDLVDLATFDQSATDSASTTVNTSGQIVVADSGVSTAKIAADAVTTAKILDANVTKAKIEDVADYKVLGNVSGGSAAPAEVAILDEDNMSSDSATSLATQQSIKAYVDTTAIFTESFESAETSIPAAGTPVTFSHGLSSIPKIAHIVLRCKSAEFNYSVGDEIVIGDYGDAGQVQNIFFNTSTIGWGHMYDGSNILIKDKTSDNYRVASSPNFMVVLKAFA